MEFAESDTELLKKYKLQAQIGSGAFSEVFVGKSVATAKQFAIKCIDRKRIREEEDNLKHEIEVMRRVSHDNIIHLVDVVDTKWTVYLIMDLVTGGELFDRILERGSYTEKDASIIVAQMLDAIGYLHDLSIVHRDLKPENILYHSKREDSKIVISDFGLATYVNEDKLRTSCGTPGYIAPEVLLETPYDFTVDCWAIGVITFILLCGYPPFYDEDDTALLEQTVKGEYSFESPYWDNISETATQFIKGLLEVNPDERYTCKEASAHDWTTGDAASEKNIQKSVAEQMRKIMIKAKWKRAFNCTAAISRMKALRISP